MRQRTLTASAAMRGSMGKTTRRWVNAFNAVLTSGRSCIVPRACSIAISSNEMSALATISALSTAARRCPKLKIALEEPDGGVGIEQKTLGHLEGVLPVFVPSARVRFRQVP